MSNISSMKCTLMERHLCRRFGRWRRCRHWTERQFVVEFSTDGFQRLDEQLSTMLVVRPVSVLEADDVA